MKYAISILEMELDGLDSYISILGRKNNKAIDVLPEMKKELIDAILILKEKRL